MADMSGAIKSNHFRVRDPEAFKEWFAQYSFGSEVLLTVDGHDVSFGGYQDYPSAYPQICNIEEFDWAANPDNEGIEWEEWEEADLDLFADELRQHLDPGQLFYVVAGGNERLRYVGFQELAISHEGLGFRTAFSDDDGAGRELIGITPPEPTIGPKVNDPPHRTLDLGDG